MNHVWLIGRLTRDPELKYLPSGTAVCNFGFVVNKKVKDQESGEYKDYPMFVDVTAWQRVAETTNEYLSKGSQAAIHGELEYQTWETDDGQKRGKHLIRAISVTFLDSKKEIDENDGGSAPAGDVDMPPDDDIPF